MGEMIRKEYEELKQRYKKEFKENKNGEKVVEVWQTLVFFLVMCFVLMGVVN